MILAALVIALFLWVFSRGMAQRATIPAQGEHRDAAAPTVFVYYRLGISLLGIWMIATSLPRLLSLGWSVSRMAISSSGDVATSGLMSAFLVQVVSAAVGLVLIVGSSGLTRLLNKFHEFGLDSKKPGSE